MEVKDPIRMMDTIRFTGIPEVPATEFNSKCCIFISYQHKMTLFRRERARSENLFAVYRGDK